MKTAGQLTAVLLAILVGGCVGGGSGSLASPEPLDDERVVEFSETTGAIQGLVVSDELYPLANATVNLEDAQSGGEILQNTTTSSQGAFVFSRIPPGLYRLHALAEGFGGAAILVQVRAGEVVQAQLVLRTTPSNEPYVAIFGQRGFWHCALSIIITSGGCSIAENFFDENNRSFQYPAERGHRAFVVETTWDDSRVTMEYGIGYFNDTSSYDDWHFVTDDIGLPVFRKELRSGEFNPGWRETVTGESIYEPLADSNQSFILEVFTFYDGLYQQEMNNTLGAVCVYSLGYCTGVGVAFEFRYEQFMTVFYNQAPADLASYSALPDQ